MVNLLEHWNIILQQQNSIAADYLKIANENKNTNYKFSALNIRYFLENIVEEIIKIENVDTDIKILKDKIDLLQNRNIINDKMKRNFTEVRLVGNKGAHESEIVDRDELYRALQTSNEISKYYVGKYLLKNISNSTESTLPELEQLPSIEENEAYVFECLKSECRLLISHKSNLKVCKKCGGPVEFKDIITNYIPYDEDIENDSKDEEILSKQSNYNSLSLQKVPIDNKLSLPEQPIEKRYRLEVYNRKLELVKEVELTKAEVAIGRISNSVKNIDVDLSDIAYDENGNSYVSRNQAHLYKHEEDYYIQAKSEMPLHINKNLVEVNNTPIKLENKDLIVIGGFIALKYIVY